MVGKCLCYRRSSNPDNNGKVKILRYGKQLQKIITEAIEGEDAEEFGDSDDQSDEAEEAEEGGEADEYELEDYDAAEDYGDDEDPDFDFSDYEE